MSENIRLNGRLPKGDRNGLGTIAPSLIHRPGLCRVAVVILDCETITTHADTGEVVPTARVRRIEVVGKDDLGTARQLVKRALERRMGREMLPLDLQDELGDLASAFAVDDLEGEAR